MSYLNTMGAPKPLLKIVSLSSLISFIATGLSIVGFGWNLHKEILADVNKSQKEVMISLEEKFSLMLNTKLEREPAAYQILSQGQQINSLVEKLESTSSNVIEIKATLSEIKELVGHNPKISKR